MQQKDENVKLHIGNSCQKEDGIACFDEIMDAVSGGCVDNYEKAILAGKNPDMMKYLSRLKTNIVEAMDLSLDLIVLELGSECGVVTNALAKKTKAVDSVETDYSKCVVSSCVNNANDNVNIYAEDPYVWLSLNEDKEECYDVITMIGGFSMFPEDKGYDKGEIIRKLKRMLKPGGKIYFAVDNKYGMKYFSGQRQKNINKYFEGLTIGNDKCMKRSYSVREINELFEDMDIFYYYPYPDYTFTTAVYSDEWLPKTGELDIRKTNYGESTMLLFDEVSAFENAIRDGEFKTFANSYMVMCTRKA